MTLKHRANHHPFIPLDANQVTREMYSLVKSSTETTSDILLALQEQTEQMATLFIDNYAKMGSEGQKFVTDWLKTTRKHQIELQKAYAQGIDKIAQFIMPSLEWEFEFDPPVEELATTEES